MGAIRSRIPTRARRVVFVEGQQGDAIHSVQTPEQVAPGTIRRLWRPTLGSIAGPAPFSWVDSPPIITRPLRYKASSLFVAAGTSRTLDGAARPMVRAQSRQSAVTRQAGNKPTMPTVRNRLRSFGSRVPPLNPPSPNATSSTQ